MSRKTILILLGILIVLLGVWVVVESHKSASSGTGTPSKGIFNSLFPFGASSQLPGGASATSTIPEGGTTSSTATSTTTQSRLVEIVSNPTAGFTVLVPSPQKKAVVPPLVSSTATSTVTATATPVYPTVRFVESGTGYVYDVGAKGGNPAKVSGTVVARTAEALFGDNGASVIFRYIKTDNQTVATYLGHIVPSPDGVIPGTVTGQFLSDNISDLVMSADGRSFFYVVPTEDGASVGMTMTTAGKSQKQVFSSPFSEWLLDWTASGAMILTTKAANAVPGYAYKVSSGDVFAKIIGGVDGLTTKMSPDGKSLLYSVSTPTGISLHILRLKDGYDANTGLSTLPEKCAFTADSATVYCGASAAANTGTYPDAWYQGLAHFNDALWSITVSNGATIELDDGEGNYLDATNLHLDSKGQFLLFINKNNGSLWSFDLTPNAN